MSTKKELSLNGVRRGATEGHAELGFPPSAQGARRSNETSRHLGKTPHHLGATPPPPILNSLNSLSSQLLDAHALSSPQGIPTGVQQLDQFLFWRGLPMGELSLVQNHLGTGGTHLWMGAAAHITQQGRWAAWINIDNDLCPLALLQNQIHLSHLLVVHTPPDNKKVSFLFQELLSLSLFDLIGCDLGPTAMTPSQLRRLKNWSRRRKTAVFLMDSQRRISSRHSSLFALSLRCHKDHFEVLRARHRPAPHVIRRNAHAHLMPLLQPQQIKAG